MYEDMKMILAEVNYKDCMDDFTELQGIGLMNSALYRQKFLTMTSDMSSEEKFMVIALSVAVKNRDRILMTFSSKPSLRERPWFNKVNSFLLNKCVQYVSAAGSKFPVVKIPESLPSISAIAWAAINPGASVEKFLSNQWAAQLALNPKLQAIQKTWEVDFWTKVVSNSKNEARPNVVKLDFHEEFYKNKAADNYPLMTPKGEEIQIPMGGYSEVDVEAFLSAFL